MNNTNHYQNTAWIIWGIAAFFYFADYLARVAPGVMHYSLQVALNLNEAGFGILTASFYIPYILMQLPVGFAVDKFSIRFLLTIMSVITAIGCIIFGVAENLALAAVGRMLIGFSAAFAFVSALRLATSWFPPTMLGLLAGLTQALGMLGAAAGEAPIAHLLNNFGWRYTMFIIATLFLILAFFLYKIVKDKPLTHTHDLRSSTDNNIRSSLKIILSNKQSWINALYAGFLFVPTAVIGEAIGPAYLQYGQGLNAHQAACATGLIFIGWGFGGPFAGWLSDKLKRRKLLMVCSAIFGSILSYILIFYHHDKITLYLLCFFFGFTNNGVALSYALAAEINMKKFLGTALAFTNMASILIGALMQPLVGFVIDYFAGARSLNVTSLNIIDFRYGLQLLPFCSMIALILSLMLKETYCQNLWEKNNFHRGSKST